MSRPPEEELMRIRSIMVALAIVVPFYALAGAIWGWLA